MNLDEFIARIKSKDDKVRGDAWQNAAASGPAAIKPLAALMSDPDLEVARAAKRALWKIIRHAGRPGAASERKAAANEILSLLPAAQTLAVRREALWMLSEIGSDEAVGSIAAILSDRELREDARMVLERIPGAKSLAGLRAGLRVAPEDFKPHLAQSLRVRGQRIREYPSQKLTPVKPTTVKPAQQI